MLTTLATLQGIPGSSAYSDAYLTTLLSAADRSIKRFLKRNIEQETLTEFYSGSNQQDIVLRQFPVNPLNATIIGAANASGLIRLAMTSTAAFTTGNTIVVSGVLGTTEANGTWTITVIDSTHLDLVGSTFVNAYVGGGKTSGIFVYYDPNGYFGQSASGFPSTTLLTQGSQYVVWIDDGGVISNRGLIRRIGGSGAGFIGSYPELIFSGKLAASRLPIWPRGEGNVKVTYCAGYATVPADLAYACATLVMYMARMQPFGGRFLQSESFEAYSYSLASGAGGSKGEPELGGVTQTLKYYRESSW